MPELVGMLGTIAALLTLVGSYRLADYFFNRGPELAGLLAVGVTAAFLILFEPLMLLMGTLALVAPVAAAASHYGWSPAAMLPSGSGTSASGGSGAGNTGSGTGTSGSGTGTSGSGTGTSGSGTGTSTGNTGSSTTSSGSGTSGGGGTTGGSAPGTQCPNCGEQNGPDATFCANSSCGYKLDT